LADFGDDVVDRQQHVEFRPDGLGGGEPPFAPDMNWRAERTAECDEMCAGAVDIAERQNHRFDSFVAGQQRGHRRRQPGRFGYAHQLDEVGRAVARIGKQDQPVDDAHSIIYGAVSALICKHKSSKPAAKSRRYTALIFRS